ncbi:MAG: hypothetical protein GXP40_10970 [Chloroflexi bacterium]|nr:hypothetical protein [Chloroflexota bacterium]
MQLRCSYCHNMFALSREAALVALHTMESENLQHYDAHCLSCRRANTVARDRLERAYPNWQAEYKTMMKEAAKAEKEQAALEKKAAEAKKEKSEAKKKPKRKSHGKKSKAK